MTASTDDYADLHQSYGRCLRDKNFIDRFYAVFLASHPSIRAMFRLTDFVQQRVALLHGINVAILHAADHPLSRRATERIADVHGRQGRAPVEPALYRYWIDSLLQVIGETDPQATPELLARWRYAMEAVCATFARRYQAG